MAVLRTAVYSTAEPPKNGFKFVITRAKAKQMVEILERDHTLMAKQVIPAIKQELNQGTHDTHICFYIDDDDLDGYVAVQLTCMDLVFSQQIPVSHTDEMDDRDKECAVCPYCDPERVNCSHRREVL